MKNHGSVKIQAEKQLLISYFFDTWNLEQTLNYEAQVMEASQSLIDAPWVRIVDLTHWHGGGSEVVPPLIRLHKWSLENRCINITFINPPLLPQYMLDKYGDIYGNYKKSKSVEEAKEWAHDLLAEHTLIQDIQLYTTIKTASTQY